MISIWTYIKRMLPNVEDPCPALDVGVQFFSDPTSFDNDNNNESLFMKAAPENFGNKNNRFWKLIYIGQKRFL